MEADAVPVTIPESLSTEVIITVSVEGAPPSVAEATNNMPTSKAMMLLLLVRGNTVPPTVTPTWLEEAEEIPRVEVPDPNNSNAMLLVKLRIPPSICNLAESTKAPALDLVCSIKRLVIVTN